MLKAIFGNATAEKTLLYLANYGQGYAGAIAKTYGLSASQVAKQLLRLETAGVLVSRYAGRTKLFEFNPRLAVRSELLALLRRALELMPEDAKQRYFRQRRRPRRTGKVL